ncbi:MAG: hypothetical protein RLZZ103_261, partial [Pseudomonadota bacterium]
MRATQIAGFAALLAAMTLASGCT